MRNTPQRTRSYASPTRDKIFIWSAVVAGCGIMALLGRHAAIHRFGTDQFTGNVLFAVLFVLSIGLYCGFQSVIEDVFNRLSALFRRHEAMAIAETTTGEQLAERIGTKKTYISRLENGKADVQLNTLFRVFEGLGRRVSLTIL